MTIKIGAFFPTRDVPADPQQIKDWTQAAEDIGFDYIEVSDHVLGANRNLLPEFEGPYDVDDSFHETFCTLSFMAAITERVGLVSGVLILPQRQTALVAKQAAQVDVLSNGRLRLGVGVGWNPVEYSALGQDWKTRGNRQSEQIELMNKLWTERSVNFRGAFDTVEHAGVNPLPVQRPIPVWFGGGADATLKRAARLGSGWIPLGNPGTKTTLMIEKLNKFLILEGREKEKFGIEAWIRYGDGNPESWALTAEKWLTLGANHLTFYTSGQGAGSVSQQIESMSKFKQILS
ncbi:MAG: LLM class F420-dependent oxidoreductase [Alphaproteobacteria bacterium]|nr:LLM class F420-dependent oxidoreductase [Alphaproteobacteria bacterium]MDG1888550.1 LLM class F420-dependent oxidoreductase [Alphaproteobacteria bacterium]